MRGGTPTRSQAKKPALGRPQKGVNPEADFGGRFRDTSLDLEVRSRRKEAIADSPSPEAGGRGWCFPLGPKALVFQPLQPS